MKLQWLAFYLSMHSAAMASDEVYSMILLCLTPENPTHIKNKSLAHHCHSRGSIRLFVHDSSWNSLTCSLL